MPVEPLQMGGGALPLLSVAGKYHASMARVWPEVVTIGQARQRNGDRGLADGKRSEPQSDRSAIRIWMSRHAEGRDMWLTGRSRITSRTGTSGCHPRTRLGRDG